MGLQGRGGYRDEKGDTFAIFVGSRPLFAEVRGLWHLVGHTL